MNIFITGISRGLGLEMASHFLQKGNCVFGLSRTVSNELDMLIHQYPDTLVWHQVDLSDLTSLETNVVKLFSLDQHPIDVFLDNAATLYKNLAHRIESQPWSEMANVNIVAPVMVTKLMLDNFLHFHTAGSIVHFSSICAHRAFNGLSLMGATKAAIEAFSRTTAHEYGRFGIRSNTIVAGLLDIGMKSTVNDKLTKGLVDISSQHQLVKASSIISMVEYLISPQGSQITGQNIHVDSGIV